MCFLVFLPGQLCKMFGFLGAFFAATALIQGVPSALAARGGLRALKYQGFSTHPGRTIRSRSTGGAEGTEISRV